MLESLHVRNIALIDTLDLDFEQGLNVLSGETGAGKSILIGAITFLLGGKTGSSLIRNGAVEADVSGVFSISEKNISARAWLAEHSIALDDNRVLIRRSMRATGRGTAWVQDTVVSRQALEEFTGGLIDIHGQHDHQSLFKATEHRRFLDAFAGIEKNVREYGSLYEEFVKKRQALEDITISEQEIADKIDYLQFAVNEIDSAQLKPDEEETLSATETKLDHYERLYGELESADALLSGTQGIVPLLKRVRQTLGTAAAIDNTLKDEQDRLDNVFYEVEDIAQNISTAFNHLSFDPKELEAVQERLAVLYRLKKKYGNSIEEILAYAEKSKTTLATLSNSENEKQKLKTDVSELEAVLLKQGRILSQKRKTAAEALKTNMEAILSHLGMEKTVFGVHIEQRQNNNKLAVGSHGFDHIEFLISANPGQPLRPLQKIASGGELSRVMLALKTLLTHADTADTLIFDEIDTGIGGEVALSVADYLKKLSRTKQILCITHLAVIASHADTHIKVEKNTQADTTHVQAAVVSGDSRTEEIARMLAGDEMSKTSIQHARELLEKFSFGNNLF